MIQLLFRQSCFVSAGRGTRLGLGRQKSLLLAMFLFCCLPALATTYTVTAPHYTMHAGDAVPPCIVNITPYPQSYAAVFKGQASCVMAATSSSPAGSYRVAVSAGASANRLALVNSSDTVNFVNGSLDVIAADKMGARIRNHVTYPPGFLSAPAYPAIDVTKNEIANLVGDCKTDNAAAIMELLAYGRGTPQASVNTSEEPGTYGVTRKSGAEFTGLTPGATVLIYGLPNTIKAVLDADHLTLTHSAGTQGGVAMLFPPSIVSVTGTNVSWESGPQFKYVPANRGLIIDGVSYKIAAITDATHIVLASAPENAPSRQKMYMTPPYQVSFGLQPQTFYFPPGCYATSQPIQPDGNFWTFFGSGPQTSYFRLLPNSPRFQGKGPIQFFSPNTVAGNQNFHQFVYSLGFNVGAGNPSAAVLTTEMNNTGSFKNVVVWSDDSACDYGIDLARAYPGPGLFEDVAVYGCKNAIFSNQPEYSMTLENVTLEGQTEKAINNGNFKLSIRHLLSDNRAQAIYNAGQGNANIAILDSELLGGAAGTAAIYSGKGAYVWGRNVICKGYSPCQTDEATGTAVTRATLPREFWSGEAQSLFDKGQPAGSLDLPIEETPLSDEAGDPSKWMRLGPDASRWAGELARPTAATVYLPPGAYPSATAMPGPATISVPDSVNHLNFYQSMFHGTKNHVIINVDGSSRTPLIIEGCIYERCQINHNGPRTLVLKDNTLDPYIAGPRAGDLFVEDSNPSGNYHAGQHIWARQLNLETNSEAKFKCSGCTMWILGYKTEHETPSIVLENRARLEVLGFFFYQLRPPTPDQTPIILTDSSFFATGLVSSNSHANVPVNLVTETQKNKTVSMPYTASQTLNLNMYYSYGAGGPERGTGAARPGAKEKSPQ